MNGYPQRFARLRMKPTPRILVRRTKTLMNSQKWLEILRRAGGQARYKKLNITSTTKQLAMSITTRFGSVRSEVQILSPRFCKSMQHRDLHLTTSRHTLKR